MRKSKELITLESIYNLGKSLSRAETPSEILKISVLSLMGKLKINKIASFILSEGKFRHVYSGQTKIPIEFRLSLSQIPRRLTKLSNNIIKNFPTTLKNLVVQNSFNYLLPISYSEPFRNTCFKFVAIILLKSKKEHFTKSEREYIDFISNFTTISLKNAFMLSELKKNIFNLNTLNEFTISIFLKKNEIEIFESLALFLMGHFKIESIAIVRAENESMETFSFPETKILSLELIKKILRRSNQIFRIHSKHNRALSFAIIQKSLNDDRKYVLLIEGKETKNLKTTDLELIRTFFTSTVNAIENLKIAKLEYDIKLAYEIQKNFLPSALPQDSRIDISAISIPSRYVGGDYYDIIQISKDEIVIAIADVCGKGLPASLLMSNLQASLRSILLFTSEVSKVVTLLNKIILLNTLSEQFITFFICKIDLKKLSLEYVNAGHNPPILLLGDEFKFLETGGITLGVLDDKYEHEKIKLQRKSLLFLYTDGVVEARNKLGVEIGIDKIIKTLKTFRNSNSEEILKQINSLIRVHSEGVELLDDITMVVVKI